MNYMHMMMKEQSGIRKRELIKRIYYTVICKQLVEGFGPRSCLGCIILDFMLLRKPKIKTVFTVEIGCLWHVLIMEPFGKGLILKGTCNLSTA